MSLADHPLLRRCWYECCRTPIYVVARLAYRTRYTGVESIPKQGPVLMVSNHQSHLDPPFVGSGCPRQTNYLARDTLFRQPLFGKLLHSINVIPIDREGGGLAGIKETLRRLKRGEMVLVFPEGTRSPDGEIRPFLPGFTALAVRGKATVVPAAIEGAFDAWPRWKKFPGLGVVHIHYGPPIPSQDVQKFEERDLLAEVEKRVRECHALLRARPPFAQRRAAKRTGDSAP